MRLPPSLVVTAVLAATLAGCGADPAADSTPTGPQADPATRRPPALRDLASGPATVWAVGDGADGGPDARRLAAAIVRRRPDLFLYLGDVYEDGTAAEYAERYEPLYGPLKTRTAPTPGNHEYAERAAGYAPYWRHALGGPLPDHYALAIGGWQLLSLDSEAPHGSGSAQVAWLRAQAGRPGTCRLAFWHRPRYSASLHGDQADVAPLWDALRGHAVLVLSGHDHTSQRLRPVDGITQVVAGAGGHQPYPLNPRDRRVAYGATGTAAALDLRLRPGRAELAFRDANGAVLDRQTVRCRPA